MAKNTSNYKLSAAIANLKYNDLVPYPAADEKVTHDFLQKVVDILLDYVKQQNDRKEKILDFHHPEEMIKLLDLQIPDQGVPLSQLINDCATTLKYQVKTGHPHFFNQLSTGLDVISMAGEWLTATANTNMFTYEIAPVFILMENVVMTHMREIIGKSWRKGDSILAPGGSISNLYAFLAARHKMFPNYKEKGIATIQGQLVMFTSDQSHYSVKSCASVCGLGTDNCLMVPSDEHGRMIPAELERLIIDRKAKGHIPFFVACTAGTTVLGAFDPINEIADICKKYGMWLHVDAAWGGGLLLSRKYRHPRLTGIERDLTWGANQGGYSLGQKGTLYSNGDHQVDGSYSASKAWGSNGLKPDTFGGRLDYNHNPSGSTAFVSADRTPGYGTDVAAGGKYNFASGKNWNADVTGQYGRHYGGPGGTGKPEAGVFLNVEGKF